MLDVTPLKILIVLSVALVVLGPDKLPRLAHQAARMWGDVRRFREHVETEVRGVVTGDAPAGRSLGEQRGPAGTGAASPTASPTASPGAENATPGPGPDPPSLN